MVEVVCKIVIIGITAPGMRGGRAIGRQGCQPAAVWEFHGVFSALHVLNVVECGFHVLLQHSVPFLLSAELIWKHTKYTRAAWRGSLCGNQVC